MDTVMMLKVLVLQALDGQSDAQAEYQIMDRRTFGRFLGLDDGDRVADETTIRRFREALTEAKAMERLFARFDAHLKGAGYLAMGGHIIDASIVAAPRQPVLRDATALHDGALLFAHPLAQRGLRSRVHFRKPPGKSLPAPRAKANAARSAVRSAVEHVFAHQKGPMALFVRTIGIARARIKIGMANLVYNRCRPEWWQGRPAPA